MPEYLVEFESLDERLVRRLLGLHRSGRVRILGVLVEVDDHRRLIGFKSKYPVAIRRIIRRAYLVVEG